MTTAELRGSRPALDMKRLRDIEFEVRKALVDKFPERIITVSLVGVYKSLLWVKLGNRSTGHLYASYCSDFNRKTSVDALLKKILSDEHGDVELDEEQMAEHGR